MYCLPWNIHSYLKRRILSGIFEKQGSIYCTRVTSALPRGRQKCSCGIHIVPLQAVMQLRSRRPDIVLNHCHNCILAGGVRLLYRPIARRDICFQYLGRVVGLPAAVPAPIFIGGSRIPRNGEHQEAVEAGMREEQGPTR